MCGPDARCEGQRHPERRQSEDGRRGNAAHTALTTARTTPDQVTEVLRSLYYETALARSRHSLLPTLEVTDPSHVLFGSDWPAAPEDTVARNTDQLLNGGLLSDRQLLGVERDNALALFPRFA